MKALTNGRVAILLLAFLLSITSTKSFAYNLDTTGFGDFNAPIVVLDLTRIAGSTMQDFTVNAVITDVNGVQGTATASLSVVGGTATPNPTLTLSFSSGTGSSGSDQITLALISFKDDDTGQFISPETGDLVLIEVEEDVTTWVNVVRVNTELISSVFPSGEQNASNDANLAAAMGSPTIAISSGNNQTADAGTVLTNPIVATVTDGYGAPVSGLTLTRTGDGTASFAATDGSGQTSSLWTLGSTPGIQTLTLSATGYKSGTANASAIVTPTISIDAAGNNQTGVVGSALATSIIATVTDQFGDPVSGLTLTATPDGDGSTSTINATDGNGETTFSWTLASTSGAQSLTLTSDGYTSASIDATATADVATAADSVITSALAATTDADTPQTATITFKDQYSNDTSDLGALILAASGKVRTGATWEVVNNGGTATATYTPSEVGAETVLVVTLDGDPIGGNQGITVTPGLATAANSIIASALAATTDADTPQTSTVTFKDQHSNVTTNLGSQTLAASGEVRAGSTWAVVNTNDGNATATYTPSEIGAETTLVVTLDGDPIGGNQAITVTPGIATAAESTISSALAATTDADTPQTATITFKDQHSNDTTDLGALTLAASGEVRTGATWEVVNNGGTATATYTPSEVGAETTLVVTLDGAPIGGNQAITVSSGVATAAQSIIASALAATTDADTPQTSTITFKDQHSNVTTDLGALTLAASGEVRAGATWAVVNTNDGNATATYTPSEVGAETVLVVTLDGAPIGGNQGITVTPGIATAADSIIASALAATTDADTPQTSTVTFKDQHSNVTTNLGSQTLAASGEVRADATWAVVNTNDGNATTTYTPSEVGAETALVVTLDGATIGSNQSISVTPGAADHIILSVSPEVIGSNGSSTAVLTALIKDAKENTVTDSTDTVAFTATTNATLITFPAQTSVDAIAGEATLTVTSVSDGTGGAVSLFADSGVLTQGATTLTTTPFFLDQATVTLLTSESFAFTATGGTSSTAWTLSSQPKGTLSDLLGETSTYTAGSNAGSDNVTIEDTIGSVVTNTTAINVYEPVTTTITSPIGMITGSTLVHGITYNTSGGDGDYTFTSSNATIATVDPSSGLIEAVATGTFTVTVDDEVSYDGATAANTATTATIQVVAPLAFTNTDPVYLDTNANSTETRTVNPATGTGTFTYSSANPAFATVNATTGEITAVNAGTTTITGTDALYSNITTSITVTVSAPLSTTTGSTAITGTQTLAAGGALSITPSGGTGSYTVAVTASPAGAGTMNVSAPTNGVYDLTAPTTGAFAGEYSITITDTNSGLTQVITVYVPMNIAVSNYNILESDNSTGTVTVTGAAFGDDISFVILNSSGVEDTGGVIATFITTPVTATDNSALANPAVATIDPADVSAFTTFSVRATNTTQKDIDDNLLLEAVEIDNMAIIPEATYSGVIVDGDAAIVVGAKITANGITNATDGSAYTATSGADGTFSISLPAKASGHYTFTVSRASFITGQMNGAAYVQTGATANTTQFALTAAGMSISGDIIGLANGDIASVYAYYTSAGVEVEVGPITVTGATAGVGDAYNMGLEASHTYNRIVATAPGYTSGSDDNSTNGFDDNATNIDLTLAVIIPEAFSVTIAPGPELTFDETNAGTDISGYNVTAVDSAGVAVAAPILTTNGTDRVATFTTDQDMTVSLLNGAQVVFVYDYIDTVTTANPTLDTAIPPVANAPSATLDFTSANATQSLRNGFSATIGNDSTGAPATNPVIKRIVIVLPTNGINSTVLATLNATSPIASVILTSSAHALVVTNSRATGGQVIEVTLRIVQTNGDIVDISSSGSGLLNEIQITIPFDTSIVSPGELESGAHVIYTADTLAAFLAGTTTAIPVSDIVSVDYIQGLVTFTVNHLSVFGIGAAVPAGSSSTPASLVDEAGCFIATAAFGTYQEPHVMLLREFRDQILLKSDAGSWFVKQYYHYSPPMADWIAKHDTVRAFVRVLLLPLLAISWFLVDASLLSQMLIVIGLMGMLTLGIKAARTKHVRVMLKH